MVLLEAGLPTSIVILLFALALDLTFGEPPKFIHPTVLIGRVAAYLERRRPSNPRLERLYGVALALSVISCSVLIACVAIRVSGMLGELVTLLTSGFLLKTSFAIKSMHGHAKDVHKALEEGHLAHARYLLSKIVTRKTKDLDQNHVISGTVESVAESVVDSIIAPLFYYSIAGVPAAIAYRAINTLDSMLGFQTPRFSNIGWFSSRLDTLANLLPARFAAILMGTLAAAAGLSTVTAFVILAKDHSKTRSANAGWPISAMAGALKCRLEKVGFYALGDPVNQLKPRSIDDSLRLMHITWVAFTLLVSVPLLIVRS